MKALLVNIDLMVRVVVPDNATEEEIISAATDKAVSQSHDHSWFSEGVADWTDDYIEAKEPKDEDDRDFALVG